MTVKREGYRTRYARIGYPVFESEQGNEKTEEMNGFYKELAEKIAAYADRITATREGIRILSADFSAELTEDVMTVRYKLTLRHRGKAEAVKSFTHSWKDGLLLLPQRERRFSKISKSLGRLLTVRHK